MKTQKEIETIEDIYDTSQILLKLFSKYKNYDSTLMEHYDPNTLFANRKKTSAKRGTDNTNVSIIEYKEPLLKKIIDKIKRLFLNKK